MQPLVVEFRVEAEPAHAFHVWARRCELWWPPAHTVSGRPTAITFEPRAGGRIVERGEAGEEYEWGRVLDWEPPHRLRYSWHLFFDPAEATEVEVTFSAVDGGTAVRLEQRGWERIGDAGPQRRERTATVWGSLAPRFVTACEQAA
ncbi:MAG: SRPBCC domain-containing protein [Actinocatenispora sp.]